MKGQALAIALVIASGVAMFVMYLSNFESLRRTQQAYYDRQRFADVFASAKRAPQRVAERLAEIPGVAVIDTRVVADVTLDVPGVDVPARGRLISVPAAGRPLLNDVFLRRGRWIDPARPDEVLVSEAFASANAFEPGQSIAAIINGRRRVLRIVGIALSPEYVYTIPPGELIPDDRRYGVLWMEQRALASAFNMEGGFNDVAVKLMPGASSAEVIASIDRVLAPYGGLGAIPRALQFSHWTLDSELTQLQNFGFIVPALFLAVAAFILNVALTRALTLQRPQIAALKALGYTNAELAWHYLKWALLIAALGAALGIAAGAWLGSAMIQLYNLYFRFPVLDYRLSVMLTVAAALGSLGAAALGALSSVRRAVRIPPAEAMRPEPPARYRVGLLERGPLGRRLGCCHPHDPAQHRAPALPRRRLDCRYRAGDCNPGGGAVLRRCHGCVEGDAVLIRSTAGRHAQLLSSLSRRAPSTNCVHFRAYNMWSRCGRCLCGCVMATAHATWRSSACRLCRR